MPINALQVDQVFNARGTLAYGAAGFQEPETGTYPGLEFGRALRVDARYRRCNVVVGPNEVRMTAVANAAVSDGVNVNYEGAFARYGWIDVATTPNAALYSDGFSGCAFYLFRSGASDKVFGVHASRESGKIIDPYKTFAAAGYKLIWFWDSVGILTLTQLQAYNFSAVFCVIAADSVTAYSLRMNGQRVESVQSRSFIPNFRRFELPQPILKAWSPPLSGLDRIKKFLHV